MSPKPEGERLDTRKHRRPGPNLSLPLFLTNVVFDCVIASFLTVGLVRKVYTKEFSLNSFVPIPEAVLKAGFPGAGYQWCVAAW